MLHLSGLVVFVVFCALSTACARRGAAPPSRRIGARIRVPPLAQPRAVAFKTQLPSAAAAAAAAAAARRVCAGALVVSSLLLGLSTPSSAASASFPSATSSPPASVTTLLPPRLSYWDFNGRLQRLEDISFTKEDARNMEAERKKEMKEMEAARKKEMKEMADTTQRNFMISSFLTVVSLFISLAANEGFMAKLLPPQE